MWGKDTWGAFLPGSGLTGDLASDDRKFIFKTCFVHEGPGLGLCVLSPQHRITVAGGRALALLDSSLKKRVSYGAGGDHGGLEHSLWEFAGFSSKSHWEGPKDENRSLNSSRTVELGSSHSTNDLIQGPQKCD